MTTFLLAHMKITPPPSVNELFRNVPNAGRVRTAAYKKWAVIAKMELVAWA